VPLADGTLTPVADEFDDPALHETLLLLSDDMSTAWHGVQQSRIREGHGVVTVGDGAVGLCALRGAAALGADPIICLGHHEDRLAIATRLGATATIRVEGETAPIVDAVRDLTDGEGAPVVIDAVSSPDSLALAQACTRTRVPSHAWASDTFPGRRPWSTARTSSCAISRSRAAWCRGDATCRRCSASRPAGWTCPPVVTHPLTDATAGYRMMAGRCEGAVTIALSPGWDAKAVGQTRGRSRLVTTVCVHGCRLVRLPSGESVAGVVLRTPAGGRRRVRRGPSTRWALLPLGLARLRMSGPVVIPARRGRVGSVRWR
jgi:hypothetical protein